MTLSAIRRYLQRKAIERAPGPVLDAVGRAVVQAADRAVEHRWEAALILGTSAPGETVEDRMGWINRRFRRELATVGAAAGAVAAAPGLGTGAAASALIADVGWFALRSADLIMAMGAASGHTEASFEERRAWVLAVLAYGENAADEFAELLAGIDVSSMTRDERVSRRLARVAAGDGAALDALRRVNANLASQVVARYGTRRGLVTVGRLLPFGVGAAVGGSTNYAMARVVGAQARRFFASSSGVAEIPADGSGPTPGRRGRRARRDGFRLGRRFGRGRDPVIEVTGRPVDRR